VGQVFSGRRGYHLNNAYGHDGLKHSKIQGSYTDIAGMPRGMDTDITGLVRRHKRNAETKTRFTVMLPLYVWPHLFRGAGHEKRRGEQLKWSLAFRLYIGSFPCAKRPGPVHTAQLGGVCFCAYLA